MKILFTLAALLAATCSFAQTDTIRSDSYSWDTSTTNLKSITFRQLFSGSGAILSKHSLAGVTIPIGQSYTINSPQEKFIIVKNGPVSLQRFTEGAELDRGSIIVVMPNDIVILKAERSTVQLYEMSYTAIATPDAGRGNAAGGSFWQNWNLIQFTPHDRGGVRQFFNRKTAMLTRFDMHVTTMNPGLKSHEPHTHKNEEIILMLQGNAEMQIGSRHVKANVGDAVYVGSMVLHNLTNTGSVPAIYYAIQWN